MLSEANGSPFLPRAVGPLLATSLRTMRVVVVTGPRQAGKSTLVRSHPAMVSRSYFSLDDAATLMRARADRGAFVRSGPVMTIDEVQRDLPLTLAVKKVVDEERPHRPGQFVLTGSANLMAMRHVSDSLAGRAYYLRLQPLTRREQQGLGATGSWTRFFETPPEHWLEMVQGERALHESWQDAVSRGGLPRAAVEIRDASERARWFEDYLLGYLEQDLGQLKLVANLPRFRTLMGAAAARVGKLVNHAELAREVKMPQTTVHEHLKVLETTFQAVRLAPFARSVKKRLIKTPKLYWNDVGLAMHVSGIEPNAGHLENYVLSDLLTWRDTEVPRPEISYWRTASGAEVDFVIERQREMLAVQVKSTPAKPRDLAHIKSFCDELGTPVRGGVVLHAGEETCWLGERILAVPWWRIL
jgi:predicted AAA+ superfamily ATPase